MMLAGFDRRDMHMLYNLFRMNLSDRFLGSSLGMAWAVLAPLTLMATFTFVFTFVFPGRLPGQDGSLPFVIWLISGYGPWLAISEGLATATGSVVANAGVVKNIAFKSELLPIMGALLGLVPLAVALVTILVLQIVSGSVPVLGYFMLPLALALHLLFVAGVGLFLGALNVFLRDTALALPNVLTVMLFVSPIFYALSSYPAKLRPLLQFNPFYVIAECYRQPLLHGAMPPLWMVVCLAPLPTGVFRGGLGGSRRLNSFFDPRL